jgi:hypothetical protein
MFGVFRVQQHGHIATVTRRVVGNFIAFFRAPLQQVYFERIAVD